MANTLHIEKRADGKLRLAIHSEGERDLSVVTTGDEIRAQVEAAEADPIAPTSDPAED